MRLAPRFTEGDKPLRDPRHPTCSES